MSRAVLSAGSNIGDRNAHLASVVSGFADELIAVSHVYATPPWGGVEQDDFLNAALLVEQVGNLTNQTRHAGQLRVHHPGRLTVPLAVAASPGGQEPLPHQVRQP